ncbi:MAG: tetratricopeptide repeat protein [Proteobacteria bacterium]|jgi:Flp pilus assembly protein TadD|nr:tetratricopeptide repeat protein [Pseudomonadota bacterium]
MKKKITIFLFLGLISGCGSTPKQEVSESIDLTPAAQDSLVSVPTTTAQPPRSAPAPVAQNPLTDAIKSGSDEQIFRAATEILSSSPQDLKALNAMGLYHYRKSQFQAALFFFSRGLKTAPNSSDLYNNIGLAHLGLGDKREAILAFRKAIELNPNDANAAANLGFIYLQDKDHVKAKVAFEMAMKKHSKDPRVLTNYGVALAAARDFSSAEKQYQEALKLNSNFQPAMLNLAILYVDHQKEFDKGLALINKMKFLGLSSESRSLINALENKAKAGVK